MRSSTTVAASRSTSTRKFKSKSAAEVVLTVLHAGGKFGGDGYKVSGGLHGVGVSVVNALSERCEVEIDRDGQRYFMDFAKGGKVQTKLAPIGKAPRDRTGTTVRFWPDPTIFEEVHFRTQTLLERLQMMAFLNKGLEIRVFDERVADKSEPIDVPVRRRHRRLRPPRQRLEGGAVQAGRLLRAGRGGTRRSRSRSSGTPASTATASTRSPTASTPSRAACTRRASRRPSPTRSTSTPATGACSRRRRTTSRARTSVRASPPSSRCACRIPSSRVRPRASSATSRCAHWSSGPPTRS